MVFVSFSGVKRPISYFSNTENQETRAKSVDDIHTSTTSIVNAKFPRHRKASPSPFRLASIGEVRLDIHPAAVSAAVGGTSRPAEGRALANRGVPFTPLHEEEAVQTREEDNLPPTTKRRWDLKAGISRMLRVGLKPDERGPAVCGCGCPGHDEDEVTIHRAGAGDKARAWVSGIRRCGSAWLCPTCSPGVARVRQARVQRVVEATVERDGCFVMGLVTVRHRPTDRLVDIKRLVTDSFASARRGAPWERIRARGNVAGVLIAPEVTHGGHGWHYHLHFGMPCLADEASARNAGEALVRRFIAAVEKRGGTALRRAQGVEVAASPRAAAEYIAKGTAWELAAGASGHKDRAKGRTHWDIAEDAIVGDVDAFALWREYAEVMPGSRSCVLTVNMKEVLGLASQADDDDDDENNEQVLTEDVRVVGTVPCQAWRRILRVGLAGTFLSRVEAIAALDGTGYSDVLAATIEDARIAAARIAAAHSHRLALKAKQDAMAAAIRNAPARAHLVRQAAARISDAAGTATAIQRAAADFTAANPTLEPLTLAEVVAAFPRAA